MQIAASVFCLPLDMIEVIPHSATHMHHSAPTGGSLASDMVAAVRNISLISSCSWLSRNYYKIRWSLSQWLCRRWFVESPSVLASVSLRWGVLLLILHPLHVPQLCTVLSIHSLVGKQR